MGKHDYGSGSIFRVGRIWHVQVWVDGKPIKRSSHSEDKQAARDLRDELLGKRRAGEFVVAGQWPSCGELLEQFLDYAKRELKPETAYIYELVVRAHLLPFFGRVPIDKLTVEELRSYRRKRGGSVKDTTINRELALLSSALYRARHDGLAIQVPPFPMAREDNARQGFIEEPDFLRFLDQLPCPGLRAFAACAYYAGMRRGELIRLRLDEIDLERNLLTIREAKGGEGRVAPIFDGVMRAELERVVRLARPRQQLAFVWLNGGRISIRNFYDAWHAAADRAGLAGYIPHDSRRSAARNMRNRGVPQAMRMKVLGHKTDSMDRRYSIVDLQDVEAVRELWAAGEDTKHSKTTPKVRGAGG